jgi:hypothetical protein
MVLVTVGGDTRAAGDRRWEENPRMATMGGLRCSLPVKAVHGERIVNYSKKQSRRVAAAPKR